MAEWWTWADTPRDLRCVIRQHTSVEPCIVLYIKRDEEWPEELKGPRVGSTLMNNLPDGYRLFSMGRKMTQEEIDGSTRK